MPTKAQLQTEVDRLTCELMRFNGVDIDEIDRLRERLAIAEADVKRLHKCAYHLNEALGHGVEAQRAGFELGELRAEWRRS